MDFRTAVLTFESHGKILTMGSGHSEYKAYGIEGFTGLDYDFLTSKSPQSPITHLLNRQPLPRQINININTKSANRQALNEFFNPPITREN